MWNRLSTFLIMGSLTDHWSNSAGNKKASMCICFNSEELLRIKAIFWLIIFKLSSIRFVPVQDLTGWCWLQSYSGFFYDFGSCESGLKNKTKFVDISFSTWLEEALERRSKYLASLFASPKYAADSMECTSVVVLQNQTPHLWQISIVLVAPGSPLHLSNIHVFMVGTNL